MKMKKIISTILAVAALALALVSCYPQDQIYKEYVVVGGHVYPAKAINLKSSPGHNRIVLSWDLPKDPSIIKARIYWDNRTDSLGVSYATFPDGHVSISVNELEERSYSFEVVNFDDYGNKSLAAELTARPLGASWIVKHSERQISSYYMDGTTAVITLTKSTDEMAATKFRIHNLRNEVIEYDKVMEPSENVIRIPNVLKGKPFEYTSSFYEQGAADVIWNPNWTKSATGIPYPLSTKDWKVVATTNQVRSGYDAEKIFDGVSDDSAFSWFSSSNPLYRRVFPKILALDAGNDDYTIMGFEFYMNATRSNYRYIKDLNVYAGSEAYDPDTSNYLLDYGNPACKASFDQAEASRFAWMDAPVKGRYSSIVFKTSWDAANGYIDLWELVPYGYLESEAN